MCVCGSTIQNVCLLQREMKRIERHIVNSPEQCLAAELVEETEGEREGEGEGTTVADGGE